MPYARFALPLLLWVFACGHESRPTVSLADATTPTGPPAWAGSWSLDYRLPTGDRSGPRLAVDDLVGLLMGPNVPPPLVHALETWIRGSLPPRLARFLHAWEEAARRGPELVIDGRVVVASERGYAWARESWREVALVSPCEGWPVDMILDPEEVVDLVGAPQWRPFLVEVATSSGSVHVAAHRRESWDLAALRRLRLESAVLCATDGELADFAEFLQTHLSCSALARELGAYAAGLCAEGLRRLVDAFIDSDSGPIPVEIRMEGRGVGRAPQEIVGLGPSGGLSLQVGGAVQTGRWKWSLPLSTDD